MCKSLFYLVVLFSIILISCKENTVTTESTGKISGIVLTQSNLAAVKSALISTTPSTETILTDSSGKFQLNNLPPGDYIVYAEKKGLYKSGVTIRVTAGNTSKATILLPDSVDNNNPPGKPMSPSPADNSILQKAPEKLSWSCTDPDGNQLTFTVLLGNTVSSLTAVATEIKDNFYYPSGLNDSSDYYWRIIAKDNFGASSESPVWKFTTKKTSIPDPDVKGYVLYYNFNGNVSDQSSNGYDGVEENLTYTMDRKGNLNSAGMFDNSHVQINYPDLLSFNKGFSCSMWIKPNADQAKKIGTHIDLLSIGIAQITPNVTQLYFGMTDGYGLELWNGISMDFTGVSSVLSKDIWSQVAFTVKNIGNNTSNVKLYVNGALVSESMLNSFSSSEKYILRIGRRVDYFTYFYGAIDDFYLFNRELTETEIKILSQI